MKFGLKIFLTILILVNGLALISQEISIFGGINNNIFHDYSKETPHYSSSYKSGLDYCVGIGLDSIRIDWVTFCFTLQLDKYSGKLKASDGGQGGGNSVVAEIDKLIISLGIFPLNFRLLHKMDMNFGFDISRLIHETYSGTISGWLLGQPSWNSNLEDEYSHYSSKTYIGLIGRIVYDFNISKSIIISPQYSYYFGLSNEFIEFPKETKSMRHYICISIKKKLIKLHTTRFIRHGCI